MKPKKLMLWVLTMSVLIGICSVHAEQKESGAPPETQNLKVPEIPLAMIPENQFEFQPVVDGTQVIHEFPIINAGASPLSIRDVVTNCACAKAEYPKEILPGEKGNIKIIADTTGYGGTTYDRNIIVSTNDKRNSVFHLYFSGKVEDFAVIDPKIIVLRGTAGQPLQSVVTITPKPQYPFTLLDVTVDDALKDKVKVTKDQKEGKYLVTVTNLQKTAGKYGGRLHLKTDSKQKPEIKMFIRGFIN